MWGRDRIAVRSASKLEAPSPFCTTASPSIIADKAEVGSGADDRGIAVGPIMPVTREHTRLAALKQHLAPITVVLDFVNPVLALWRLIDRGGKLRLDEAKPRGYVIHRVGPLSGSFLRVRF